MLEQHIQYLILERYMLHKTIILAYIKFEEFGIKMLKS